MAKFCGKCGGQLDDAGKCPNCDPKSHKKKHALNKRSIVAIVMAVTVLLGSVAGWLVITMQAAPITNDYTDGILAEKENKEEEDEEQAALLSPNVEVFVEDEASKINENIKDIQVTNRDLCMKVEDGTSFDKLGNGDIFYLEGGKESPLGEIYIGKIASSTKVDDITTYHIETPMVDEVFDILKIDYEGEFTAENIASIQTISGVSVSQVDDISKSFAQTSDDPLVETQMTTLECSAKKTVQVTDSSDDFGDNIVFDLNVNLLDAFSMKEEGAVGFEQYEYTEGYRINVYLTESGKRYHRENCSCLYASKEAVTLSDAVNEGYEPCFICVPPILNSEQNNLKCDAKLELQGKIGLEGLKCDIDYDWDVINGGGLEKLNAQAKGDFVSEVSVKSELSLELGGQPTTITIPIEDIKLQGLDEKLFPIAFITYNGASLNVSSLFPGNDYIRSVTSVIPITVGVIVYTDISGNLTVNATASFSFDYGFDCAYTAVKDGQWVNEWKSQGEPSFKTELAVEGAGDFDAHVGCSVSLYVYNLNVAELAIAKVGFEGEGDLSERYVTERRKVSDEWEKTEKGEASGSMYGRLYLKILEARVKLKTRAKIWSSLNYSNTVNYTGVWLDKTIAEWGRRNETKYNSLDMSYSAMTAKDQQAIYYKDTNDQLVKEVDGYREVLYDKPFFSLCGIDMSYVYLIVSTDDDYEIYRVAKDGSSSKMIAQDVSNQLTIDEKYLYYVSSFDQNSIVRLDRQTLKEDQFATFEDEVRFMAPQKNNFYVVTEEGGLFASIFGGTSKCYLLNESGGVLESYGESPQVNQYYMFDYDTYYEASRIICNGYLRSTASEVYWVSKDGANSVLTEEGSGWVARDAGIFVTLPDEQGDYRMMLYRAADGVRVDVTDVCSDQAQFTICHSDGGEWYYFDQTDSDVILYALTEDFGSKTEIKRFSLDEISYNLTDCATEIMDNTIYFYTMQNDTESKMLYRYNILSDEVIFE